MPRTWSEATTVGDLLDRAATQSDGDALVFSDERATYPELSALTTRFARSLRALGVGPGDKVGVLMPSSLDFVGGFIGASKLGAIPVPVNGRFKAHELGHVIGHADMRVLLTAPGPEGTVDYPALLEEVFPELGGQDAERLRLASAPELRQIVDLSGGGRAGFLQRDRFDAAAAEVAEQEIWTLQERVRIRDIGMLLYTSGTTATPKGCLLTHEALVRNAVNVARTRFLLTPDDVFWNPLPLFHIGGVSPMLSCFCIPCTYCHAGHFDADVALRMLEQERVTVCFPAFETIWMEVLNHPRFAEADLSSIRLVQNIAVPERLAQMQERMPWAIEVSSYGGSEAASHLVLPVPDDPLDVRINTLGLPMPGMEVKIVDPETRAERPPGEVGEISYRGYSRFEGYYKEPELTAKVIDADGWFYSGDLGILDENGRLQFAGRLKDMLKVGGENVSALEVEDYLLRHKAVKIVQVVSAPDARYTEVPAAFVELQPGAELTEEELIDFCLGKIATYKVPRYVRIVTEWPMSGTKIQKFVLREWIAKELEQRGVTEAPHLDSRRATAR